MKECVYNLHKGGFFCGPVFAQNHIKKQKKLTEKLNQKQFKCLLQFLKKIPRGQYMPKKQLNLKKKFSAFNLSTSPFQQRVVVLENLSLFHSQLPTKISPAFPAILSESQFFFFFARVSLHFKYKSPCPTVFSPNLWIKAHKLRIWGNGK